MCRTTQKNTKLNYQRRFIHRLNANGLIIGLQASWHSLVTILKTFRAAFGGFSASDGVISTLGALADRCVLDRLGSFSTESGEWLAVIASLTLSNARPRPKVTSV